MVACEPTQSRIDCDYSPLWVLVFVWCSQSYLYTDDSIPEPRRRVMLAACGGDAPLMSLILTSNPECVDCTDEAGDTPLIMAARFGHADVARVLIDAGADYEIRNKV